MQGKSYTIMVVVTVVSLVFAVVTGSVALSYVLYAHGVEDKLKVVEARAATGLCGGKQIVVIDEMRIAVAGDVYDPSVAANLRFEGAAEDLKVYSASNELLMDRTRRMRR